MKKILVTLGPSSLNEKTIKAIAEHRIHLFRVNLSHTDLNDLHHIIELIRANTTVPICIDSEGAQIRNGKMIDGKVCYQKDSEIKIHFEDIVGDDKNISFFPVDIARSFQPGDVINIDFDLTSMLITRSETDHAMAKVIKGGLVGNNKAADLSREIPLPALTEKDQQAFALARQMGIRHFALSFANRSRDVEAVRAIVGPEATIISKIESRTGLGNLKSILQTTDEILIDRGDLSRQVSIEKIPFLQRRIISMAKIFDRPVYVATNLLENMIKNRVPTRAEANDIVSTIDMGADGLVLAAETAVGKYPVESAGTVRQLAELCRRWTPNTNIMEILEM